MESRSSHRRTRPKQRQQQAWQLRLAGHSLREIARQLGVSIGTVCGDVQRAFQEYQEQWRAEAKHFAELDLARIETILARLWPGVLQGDVKSCLAALRVLERRAKLLGLDAATKVQLSQDESAPSVDDLRQRLVAALGGNQVTIEEVRAE